jgi:tetratricopeptide (TPR) repeat protein
MRDALGLEISTNDAAAVAAVDQFRFELGALGAGIGAIMPAADAHPDQAYLQSCAASLCLYGQCAEADGGADVYLARARAASAGANARERAFLATLEDWRRRRYEDAIAKLEALVAEWPRDLIAVKALEFLYFVRGQHYSGPRFLKTMQGVERANTDSGHFLAVLSFAQHLWGRSPAALAPPAPATALEPDNSWAHHTMAHAFLKTGAIERGAAVLEGQRPVWDAAGQVMHSHNYWHLALMYLEQRQGDKALGFLDAPIMADMPHIMVQLVDAASLLWRLEMAGFPVAPARWAALADEVTPYAGQCYTAFNSAHLVYALARAGRDAELADALAALDGGIAALGPDEQAVWREVGLELLRGCIAFARDRHADAAALLGPLMGPARESVVRVGGSDAQVDLFRQAYLCALIGAGEKSAARAYLDRISTSPTATPLRDYWHARC